MLKQCVKIKRNYCHIYCLVTQRKRKSYHNLGKIWLSYVDENSITKAYNNSLQEYNKSFCHFLSIKNCDSLNFVKSNITR